jgi:hypothetical protein
VFCDGAFRYSELESEGVELATGAHLVGCGGWSNQS